MSKRGPKLQVYKARDGWRWRLRASNGRIVCESGEAFRKKPSALEVSDRLMDTFYEAWRVEFALALSVDRP